MKFPHYLPDVGACQGKEFAAGKFAVRSQGSSQLIVRGSQFGQLAGI